MIPMEFYRFLVVMIPFIPTGHLRWPHEAWRCPWTWRPHPWHLGRLGCGCETYAPHTDIDKLHIDMCWKMIYIHTYIYIYIYIYINTYIHTDRHTDIQTYRHTDIHYITLHYITIQYITIQYITLHTDIHTQIHTYIHRYTHAQKYVYIYIYT